MGCELKKDNWYKVSTRAAENKGRIGKFVLLTTRENGEEGHPILRDADKEEYFSTYSAYLEPYYFHEDVKTLVNRAGLLDILYFTVSEARSRFTGILTPVEGTPLAEIKDLVIALNNKLIPLFQKKTGQ